jgi:cob(I)alamin adenosyltransferase
MKAKIYTKTGDQGKTALVGGSRVSKSDPRLEAYGTVDELNSALGIAVAELSGTEYGADAVTALQKIQNELFNLGSRLACVDEGMRTKLPHIESDQIMFMEEKMDLWEQTLPTLKNFILPGGSKAAAQLHLARTICRRAERATVTLAESAPIEANLIIYLNRLSDYLFTMARAMNQAAKAPDIEWTK